MVLIVKVPEEDIELTIWLSPGAYQRALEIVSETDVDMRRRYGLDEEMSVADYLALLLERKLA
jgi:hypothetical protein